MTSVFGDKFSKVWPSIDATLVWNDFGKKLLSICKTISKPKPLELKDLINNSSQFPIKFPINTCRIISQPSDRHKIIEEQSSSAYPVIHERVLWLYTNFLEHKLAYGTTAEKRVYQNIGLLDFVQRLLDKRCVTFMGVNDKYLLISGDRGASGFVPIGSNNETAPLILENCLSYDEIKLSALLSVSSYTEFINSGHRQNVGIVEQNKNTIVPSGIIMGLIGARLTRREFMEFQDIVVSKMQNVPTRGYGPKPKYFDDLEQEKAYCFREVWSQFYEEPSVLYKNVVKDNIRYGPSKNSLDIFDNLAMKKRYTISFDTMLLECESRSKSAKKPGYLHVVGFGLGVWKACEQQDKIFLETFEQRLKVLGTSLQNISYVHFSWFKLDKSGDIFNGNLIKIDNHPNNGIQVFLSKRDPAAKLKVSEDCLLFVTYAWDGNALPGNEFWIGMLKSTGDSSTACSTLITELHNPHINKTMVSGANLHIATNNGVYHISDYVKTIL